MSFCQDESNGPSYYLVVTVENGVEGELLLTGGTTGAFLVVTLAPGVDLLC